VDDNQIICDTMKRLIKTVLDEVKSEIEIVTFQDGFDILKFVIENEKRLQNIKCIFTDENMDFMNGSEAIKLLRIFEKKEKFVHIYVISTTCYEDPKQVNYILSSGADMVLSKPISKNSIINCFEKFGILNG